VILAVHLAHRWAARWLPGAVIAVFALASLIDLPGAFRPATRDGILRQAGQAVRACGFSGPIACNHRGTGMYVAYFSGLKLLTLPPADSVGAFQRDCRTGGVRCVVIATEIGPPHEPSAAERAVQGNGWRRRTAVADARARIEVYERVGGD
jgi:hypothetical protein